MPDVASSLYAVLPLGWPLQGDYRITQEYGEKQVDYARFGLLAHNGLDIAAPAGTPILAAHAGQVWAYADPGGYGITTEIWYPSRSRGALLKTIYGHQSSRCVADGAWVVAGQAIGLVGSTGNSSGPHLHFGVKWLDGRVVGMRDWVDPRPYLPIRSRYK